MSGDSQQTTADKMGELLFPQVYMSGDSQQTTADPLESIS